MACIHEHAWTHGCTDAMHGHGSQLHGCLHGRQASRHSCMHARMSCMHAVAQAAGASGSRAPGLAHAPMPLPCRAYAKGATHHAGSPNPFLLRSEAAQSLLMPSNCKSTPPSHHRLPPSPCVHAADIATHAAQQPLPPWWLLPYTHACPSHAALPPPWLTLHQRLD